jgi:hypothetical protein
MSGGMPYQLEKGPYFSVAESMLDLGCCCEERFELLKSMLAGADTDALPTLDSQTLGKGPLQELAQRLDHQNEHWFGKQRDPEGRWLDQPAFDPQHPKPTGYWYQWYGDAEAIVREVFVRAIEVSLGIDHGADLQTVVPMRCWPIEIFWRCPAPWMEGWVTWRREREGSGHVTIHLHTPGHYGSALLLSPIRTTPDSDVADYVGEPVRSDAERGMWVITHERQVQYLDYEPSPPSPRGEFLLPTFGPMVQGTGPIVCVQPNEPDGGVRRKGRAYNP